MNQNLVVVPTTGGSTPRELATCDTSESDFQFAWSPTSNVIAYDCNRLTTVRPDGTHLRALLKNPQLLAVNPQWSPDGSRLLFVAGRSGSLFHLYTIRANGRDLTRRG